MLYWMWKRKSSKSYQNITINIETGKCENWIVIDEYRHLLLTVKPTPKTSPFVYSDNNHGFDFPDYWDDSFFVSL